MKPAAYPKPGAEPPLRPAAEDPVLRGVVYVCGAGGKTSFIKRAARRAAGAGLSVVILTTTRMLREEQTMTDAREALRAIAPGRIVLAGKPWEGAARGSGEKTGGGAASGPEAKGGAGRRPEKVTAFPEEEMKRLKAGADLALIEADGARHCLLKVPYAHEPVIGEDADRICILYGPDAVGRRVREVCYNPEGVEAVLWEALRENRALPEKGGRTENRALPEDGGRTESRALPEAENRTGNWILTEEDCRLVLERGYAAPLRERFPHARVEVVRGMETRFHLILLAAGLSRRFGSNKLLYPVDGKPMYRHMADRLLALVREDPAHMDLVVVTSYEEIRQEMEAAGAEVVINPDPARGISSSIHCALRALEEGRGIYGNDFLLFFNGDQPGLRRSTIRRFARELKSSGRRLGAVWDRVDMRSPCAFGSEYVPELLRVSGDRGGKGILRRQAERVFLFSVENAEELEDMDSL